MNLSYKKKKITLHDFLLLNKKDQMWLSYDNDDDDDDKDQMWQ